LKNSLTKEHKDPSLTIVVPVYNEEDALRIFLPNLTNICRINRWKIIIVNDGSIDQTASVLSLYKELPNLKIITHKKNRGYGAALKTGITNVMTTFLVTIDGDGQHSVNDINDVYRTAIDNDADLVVGARRRIPKGSRIRESGKKIIKFFTRLLMPLPVKDLNSGFKLYRTEYAQRYLHVCPTSMAFSDVITLVFIQRGDLVMEHPITVNPRRTGKSNIKINTAFETILEILNLVVLFNPMRVFFPLSLFLILIGIGWGIPFALLGRGISTGSLLAIVLGAIMFSIGLIASQLSSMRMSMIDGHIERKRSEK
jgi:glycosyltransferase involved in cell wall biosynthesis